MIRNQLKEKLEEQRKVYEALKAGDAGLVCYKEFQNGEWGTDDANYTNRLRLAYYLLYDQIDDENIVEYLFREELKDRENNSFQGIGSTLCILTWLLRKYNQDHKYDSLFEQAKNANFDCACGYDPEDTVEEAFDRNDLLDCIYLCRELEYKDVMGLLVEAWKKETEDGAGWNHSNRRMLIEFQACLGREGENEKLYLEQLQETLEADSGKARDIIAGYRDLIRHYLDVGDYGEGARYCRLVLETMDCGEIRGIRLFDDILEECCEVIAQVSGACMKNHSRHLSESNSETCSGENDGLWKRIKAELKSKSRSAWYGNLYSKAIAAGKAMNDPYAQVLEREYLEWRKDRGIVTE
ncbi:hypothetical protein NSB25_04520 [Acetatifactor muris]|uniref:Uncharacterized protein n=1 Tax=Acetatifactor muris TaxID=879566 RepID=A0A2K4ZBQ6_9FIRM|nr:hypothetical protein [Acetatifactor muris]MCI8801673.1 hypothetical protein [Lachnospiraceae bacterium]MCR2046541.1 hypothetical protein [Acetatifactor muris]SOY27891.1 hypothetical protein AMURIS_00595 [Acetatifactor muris]